MNDKQSKCITCGIVGVAVLFVVLAYCGSLPFFGSDDAIAETAATTPVATTPAESQPETP